MQVPGPTLPCEASQPDLTPAGVLKPRVRLRLPYSISPPPSSHRPQPLHPQPGWLRARTCCAERHTHAAPSFLKLKNRTTRRHRHARPMPISAPCSGRKTVSHPSACSQPSASHDRRTRANAVARRSHTYLLTYFQRVCPRFPPCASAARSPWRCRAVTRR